MPNVTVTCDRCHQSIQGFEVPGEATSGFYRTDPPGMWAKFVDPGEHIICDACMFADSRYQAVYGVHTVGEIITTPGE